MFPAEQLIHVWDFLLRELVGIFDFEMANKWWNTAVEIPEFSENGDLTTNFSETQQVNRPLW